MQLNHHRAGSGEPLVLIHGIGSRWQVWEPVLDRLTAERDVVAIDLPGFAGSPDPPAGTVPGTASLTRLVAAFLDGLGLDRPHLAGNSLGGRVALELVKQGHGRSATALSPSGFHDHWEALFQKASLYASVRVARRLTPWAERVSATPLRRKLLFGQVAARPERISPEDAAATLRALASASWFDETLRAIHATRFSGGEAIRSPVTIAWGEHDRLLVRRQLIRALREIPAARGIILHGCGHVPTYDDPAQVADVILEGSL